MGGGGGGGDLQLYGLFSKGIFPSEWTKSANANNLPSTEQPAKTQPKQVSFFLSIFIVFNRLSVVLWLDKGDFSENVHTVCPC